MDLDAQTLPQPHGNVPRAVRLLGGLSDRTVGVAVPLLITVAAGFARFWRLSSPHRIVPLDETYYAPNSLGYLCYGADTNVRAGAKAVCSGLDPAFAVHPPVAKLLTAVGIKIFGYRPFGWRFAAALVGTLSVLLVYLIARRLWNARWPAATAAILVAVDGLFFVQSRLAMLDIFVAFFVLLGVWTLLEDRARTPSKGRPRWWRLGSGVAFGLAVSSKWSAVPMLPVLGAIALAWEVARIQGERAAARAAQRDPEAEEREAFWGAVPPSRFRRAGLFVKRLIAGMGRAIRGAFVDRLHSILFQALALLVTFLIVPAIVYLASYTSWFLSTKRYVPPRCNDVVATAESTKSVPKAGMALWLCNQKEILDYHRNLKAIDEKGRPIHPYMSRAWSWPWISRPASHYFLQTCLEKTVDPKEGCPLGSERDEEILGLPNPAVWWFGFVVALPACAYWMIKKRDETAAILVLLFAPLVVPWFVYSRPIFMFYMAPAVPFLVLMVVHVLQRWRLRWSALGFVAVAIALFGYFYPVLAAYPIPEYGSFGWRSRIWYGHVLKGDCREPVKTIELACWI
jgi:dolichyl-phosphate-mannose-protein mannosyltransferase